MSQILYVTSSPRGESSHSSQISGEFVEAWLQAHPGDTVVTRDLNPQTIPHVTEELIGAMYTPAEARTDAQKQVLALSDTLIAELKAADVYVFAVPMYNFSVPAVFKAYIDQIARVNETWSPSYEGLLKNKKAFIVTARGGGGYGPGETRAAANFEDPYLQTVLGFVGVTDVTFVHINNTANGEEAPKSLTAAREQIKMLAAG